MRALTRASGMRRASLSSTRLGQISCSVKTARPGRQWSRNRPTNSGASSGTYWWIAPAGRRVAASRADVTVPVVNRTDSRGRHCQQGCDQRQHRVGLADAGGMKPDDGPGRPRRGRLTQPLAAPRRILLAALGPQMQDQPGRGPRERGQRAVAGKGKTGLGRKPRALHRADHSVDRLMRRAHARDGAVAPRFYSGY